MTESPTSRIPPARETAPGTAQEPPLGAIVHDLTTQVPELIRSEMKLAQAELAQKGKRAGLGIGMFGGAGIVALYGVGTLLATVILLLALVMDAWIAALIVTVVLFVVAGVLALLGKKQVEEATPPLPERAVEGVKEDIATVKGQHP
ncbi:MAG: phage holin family protein [Marmoricola sp.]|nr:phage holin family protein [Marmoricola sp.]